MFTFISHTFPVSTNKLYIRPQGRYVLSNEARTYKLTVGLEYKSQIESQLEELKKLSSDDKLEFWIYISGNWYTQKGTIRKEDLDNFSKCMIDTLIKNLNDNGVEVDDSQIFKLHMFKVESEEFVTKIEFDVI